MSNPTPIEDKLPLSRRQHYLPEAKHRTHRSECFVRQTGLLQFSQALERYAVAQHAPPGARPLQGN
jgi:hypothetical protein